MRITVKTGWAGALLAAALVLPGCGTVPSGSPGGEVSGAATSAPTTEAPAPTPTTAPATTKPVSEKPATTSKPKPKPVLAKGAKGEKVRELQVRLRQLDWYTGIITGKYGSTTVKGVKGFQGKRGLKKTGTVDATTWSQPGSGRRPPRATSATTSCGRARRSTSRARAAARSASCRRG